jgi:hypothetical protein
MVTILKIGQSAAKLVKDQIRQTMFCMNTYIDIDENTTKVLITGTKHEGSFLISKKDKELIQQRQWYIKDTTAKGPTPYVACKFENKTCKLHRFLLNPPKGFVVDHINRDTFDNRRENLRIVTYRENNLNISKRKNKIGRTGVSYSKGSNGRSPRWATQWVDNQGIVYTKTFSISVWGDKAKEMAIAYREKAEKEFGILSET